MFKRLDTVHQFQLELLVQNRKLREIRKFANQLQPGSLARTCNVTTDRLVYQDVRGLSATEPCPRAQIWGRIKPKDTGTPREPGLVNHPRLVCLGDQTCPTQHQQCSSVRVDCVGPGSSPGKSGLKAYRLYPVGIGLTPKRLPSRPSTQLLGVLQA